MTAVDVYWKQLVDEYQDVCTKILEIETKVYDKGILMTSPKESQYQELVTRRNTLLRCMGQEFPNLYARLRPMKVVFK